MDNKEKTISDAYYDLAGFSNIKEHYEDVKWKDNSITIDDVKNGRNKNLEVKKQLKGFNSFVVDKPFEEFQMDLAFFDMKDEKYVGALIMVDIFTKYCCAIPFKSNEQDEILKCIKMVLKKWGENQKHFTQIMKVHLVVK